LPQLGEKPLMKSHLLIIADGSMENEVIVTKKGQTTIPARLRKKLKIEKGTKLQVVETNEGVLFRLKKQMANQAEPYAQLSTPKEIKRLLADLREKDKTAAYFIALDHVLAEDSTLSFIQPIIANVSLTNNIYSCQNSELGIVAMSPKLEECVKDFEKEILFIWNEYGKEDSSKLTNDAKELKAKILRYIKQ
jgi:AbrB family looped-hinge helix DNA binding protein